MIPLLIVASLTLVSSFLCSLFEAAFYAITPSQLEVLIDRGRPGAAKLAQLRSNVDESIAAILTVNTIAHTVGSAWCGAMVGTHYGSQAVGVFAAIFTFAVLLLTEIIPKSIGVRRARTIGPMIAWPLQGMIWVTWPLVKAFGILMRLFSRGEEERGPTEEEVMVLSRLAAKGGHLRLEEQRWVENALRLDYVTAGDLMTPRPVVQSLPAGTRLAEVEDLGAHWVHSRIPITEGDGLDSVLGLVYRREVFDALAGGRRDATLGELMHQIDFLPTTTPGHHLLANFIRRRRHLVALTDEHGACAGIVTLEDVLECLLGTEIVDEHDDVVDMQELAHQQARRKR